MNGALGSVLGLVALLAMGLALAIGLGAWFVARRLRNPPRRTAAWAIAKGVASDPGELATPLSFTEWTVSAERGPLKGVECPVWDIAGANPAGPVVVFTPGWGDSRLGALARIERLVAHCARVIAWDSPGLGEAPGKCPLGTKEHATLLALIDRIGGDRPVVLYGWSLGAGTSIVAGADNPRVSAVVAEAPYRIPWTPAFNLLEASNLPWRLNGPVAFALIGLRLGVGPTWRGFDRAQHAANLTCPLLVVHGDNDILCPLEDGQAIAHEAPHGTLNAIEGAGHNDLWTDDQFAQKCAEVVGAFLQRQG